MGPHGVINAETEEHKDKNPILIHLLTAEGYLTEGLAPLLVDQGYEVWVGAARGQVYSNVHDRDGEWSLEERWDFDGTDMGYYDMTVMLKKMYEVTGKKAVIMGYSMGAYEALYGMAKRQDLWERYTKRFIGYAPCILSEIIELDAPYPTVAVNYKGEYDKGNFLVNQGERPSSERFFAPTIDCSKTKENICEYEYGTPIAVEMHHAQIKIARRFQERQSIQKWLKGEIMTPFVDFSQISQIPVTFVLPIKEIACPTSFNEAVFHSIKSPDSYIRFERGGHWMYWLEGDEA